LANQGAEACGSGVRTPSKKGTVKNAQPRACSYILRTEVHIIHNKRPINDSEASAASINHHFPTRTLPLTGCGGLSRCRNPARRMCHWSRRLHPLHTSSILILPHRLDAFRCTVRLPTDTSLGDIPKAAAFRPYHHFLRFASVAGRYSCKNVLQIAMHMYSKYPLPNSL
jgi:hypothetical protein